MDLAFPRHISLVRFMADKGTVWGRLVAKHGLKPYRYEEIAAWGYADAVFASDYDIISDTGKARRFGFSDSLDTEEMLLRLLAGFRAERIIP